MHSGCLPAYAGEQRGHLANRHGRCSDWSHPLVTLDAASPTDEARSAEDLVRWCQETLPRDTRAFEALVARYKQRVFATTYRLMGNPHDAEDMAQEVFLRVYRGIRNLKEPATLTSWIYRIAVNTCLDALQRERRARPSGGLVPREEHADSRELEIAEDDASPEELVVQREARECIERAIGQLEAGARSALVLRDVEDRPYQEIAEALGVGLSAVKMRIHRARLAFQHMLESLCPDVWRSSARGRSSR